jgi:hypothetical protein
MSMAMIDALLAELEQESHATRRVLERVPQAYLEWKPHPKSMSLGQLALHVATVPGNVVGWTFTWLSSVGSDFDHDFHVRDRSLWRRPTPGRRPQTMPLG